MLAKYCVNITTPQQHFEINGTAKLERILANIDNKIVKLIKNRDGKVNPWQRNALR